MTAVRVFDPAAGRVICQFAQVPRLIGPWSVGFAGSESRVAMPRVEATA